MKPRRVIITVEVESTELISELKDGVANALEWRYNLYGSYTNVIQIQANVIKKEKEVKK